MKERKQRIILGFILFCCIAIINYVLWRSGFSFAEFQNKAHAIHAIIEKNYVVSSFLYIAAFIIATVAWIPVTVIMTVAAGYFFGIIGGTIISLLGATLGCLASFLLSRYLFRKYVIYKFDRQLRVVNHELEHYGAYYLLMLHALPVTPTPLLNLLAGVTTVTSLTYAWTSFFGMFPAIVAYVIAGGKLHQLKSLSDVLSVELLAILLILFSVSLTPIIFRHLGMKVPKI